MLNNVIQIQIASNAYIYRHIHIEEANSRGWTSNPTSLPSLCWWNGCSPHSRFSYQLLHSAFPTPRYQFCLVAQSFSKTFKGSQQTPIRAWKSLKGPGVSMKAPLSKVTPSDWRDEVTWTFADFGWYAGSISLQILTNSSSAALLILWLHSLLNYY